jgi:nitrite reductase [NAD(P)H] small subunit
MAWLRICGDDELPRGRARTLETAAGRIAVFRAESGVLYAIEDRCPHRGAALSQGVLYDVCKVACSDHGWTIDLRTGEVEAPEQGEVKTFAVTLVDGGIFVSVSLPGTRD